MFSCEECAVFDGQSVLSGLGHCVLFCYAYNSTKEPWQQTSRPSFFQFWALVGLWVPVSCIVTSTVIHRSQGSRPADQHFSILGLCWSAGPCLLSCYYNSSTRQRQGPTDQQRPKIEKCWSAGLLPWLPCTTVVVKGQETGTNRPTEAQN